MEHLLGARSWAYHGSLYYHYCYCYYYYSCCFVVVVIK